MATYKATRRAIRDVVDGLSGWTPAKTLRPERIGAQDASGHFVVGFLGGDSTGQPDGGNVGETDHAIAIQFLERIDGQDEAASQDAALDRVEAIRTALAATDSLGSVEAHAVYEGYSLDDIGGYFLCVVEFTIYQIHTY